MWSKIEEETGEEKLINNPNLNPADLMEAQLLQTLQTNTLRIQRSLFYILLETQAGFRETWIKNNGC